MKIAKILKDIVSENTNCFCIGCVWAYAWPCGVCLSMDNYLNIIEQTATFSSPAVSITLPLLLPPFENNRNFLLLNIILVAILGWWFSNKANFAPQRMFDKILGYFGLSQLRCTIGIQWLETSDTAKQTKMHRIDIHNKQLSGPKCQQLVNKSC